MRKLASQTEIGVWVQAPGALGRVWGITLEKIFDMVYAKSFNLVYFRPENGMQCRVQRVLIQFNNGNAVPSVPARRFHAFPLEMTPGLL